MAQAFAAIKGRLGTTDYWIVSMKAGELIRAVKFPKEMEGWDNMSIDEYYQRKINYNRVRSQIAPYLAKDKDRFFGAIIVTVMNPENISFEPLSALAKELPNLYSGITRDMGVLTFSGEEIFVPLDGQHRVKAIEFAITGKDNEGKSINNIKPCAELTKEDVTVIFIPYNVQKSRKIFTRVNRYARQTTKGQSIIMDDDDIIAVLARRVADDKINARLVNYEKDTLQKTNRKFTTLSAIYNCNKIILESVSGKKIDKTQLPSQDKQTLYENKVFEVWGCLLGGINVFADSIKDAENKKGGDGRRKEIRENNLLGRPVVQECLVHAFMILTKKQEKPIDEKEACRRLNKLPWTMTEKNVKIWQNIFWMGGVKDGKMITKDRKTGARMIAYLAGGLVDEKKLLEDYLKLFPEDERKTKALPEKLF